MNISKIQMLLAALAIASFVPGVFGAASIDVLSSTFCGLVVGVRTVVGLLAVVLFLVGGVLYAMAHFLPTTLDYRKSLVGWSTAMILGGVIGLVVVILAVPIVSLFETVGAGLGGATAISTFTCT